MILPSSSSANMGEMSNLVRIWVDLPATPIPVHNSSTPLATTITTTPGNFTERQEKTYLLISPNLNA
jgi:hypothetical protein